MRPEVEELVRLGPLPDEETAEEAEVIRYEKLLLSIERPVTDEEACALLDVFRADDDSTFGLAWTLVHIIESAPGWPLEACLQGREGAWITTLRNAL